MNTPQSPQDTVSKKLSTERATVFSKIDLTEEQRIGLAKTLNIDVQFVPTELGILGMPKDGVSRMGMPEATKPKFSPALIMM